MKSRSCQFSLNSSKAASVWSSTPFECKQTFIVVFGDVHWEHPCKIARLSTRCNPQILSKIQTDRFRFSNFAQIAHILNCWRNHQVLVLILGKRINIKKNVTTFKNSISDYNLWQFTIRSSTQQNRMQVKVFQIQQLFLLLNSPKKLKNLQRRF